MLFAGIREKRTGQGIAAQQHATRYRSEAVELRRAVRFIKDAGLGRQLLDIADDYEAGAAMLEAEIRRQQPIAG